MSDFEETLNKVLSDPSQMEKIAELAKSLSGGDTAGSAAQTAGEGASPLTGLDPKMLALVGKLMSEYNAGSDKAALLAAISPFVKDSRRSKIEQAAQLAKLARLAKIAMAEFNFNA